MHELEQRVALVVGNNNYESFAMLKNPINDARAMKEVLEKKKFDVIYLENTSQKNFKKAIKKFANKLSKGGVGLFYFAGHGIQVDGENYLIPNDADISDKDDVDGESVPIAYLTKKLKKAGNRLNIIILDACRNDPFSRGVTGGLAPIHARGTFIAYATEAGKVAKDGKGKHGVFTKHLIKYMNEPISLDEVFKKTRTAVYNDTDGDQFPGTYNQVINGSFFFTLPKPEVKKKAVTITGTAVGFKTKKANKFLFSIIPEPVDAKIEITNIDEPYKKGMRLKKGDYNIQISKDGYETKTGNINLSSNYILKVKLKKMQEYKSSSALLSVAATSFILNIKTNPSDARVQIEGLLEDYHHGMKLDKGEYKIKVYKDGYVTKNGAINLNKNYSLSITLNKIEEAVVSKANFHESPSMIDTPEVFIDGKLMWQDDEAAKTVKLTEYSAKLHCRRLKFNGYDDCILPDIDDIKDLKTKKDKLKYFIDEKYWSSFGKVDFSDSNINAFLNTNDYVTEHDENYVRCVREY